MPKAFSESEMTKIKDKLIESCKICWGKQGYRKTSVGELCKMAGVSTGAFYLFFPSKEMLFVATANHFNDNLYKIIRDNKPEKPDKYDLARGVKLIAEELLNNQWVFSIREDYEVFLRKLPDNFMEQEYKKDLLDIKDIIELYDLVPTVAMDEIMSVIYTIFLSLYFTDIIGELHRGAVEFLLDTAIEKLFV